MEKLREAKALHDELEAVIRPFMDFAALDAFAERSPPSSSLRWTSVRRIAEFWVD